MRRASLALLALSIGCADQVFSPFDSAGASASASASATHGDGTTAAVGDEGDSSGAAEDDTTGGGGGSTSNGESSATTGGGGSTGAASGGSSGGTSSVTDPGSTGAASTGEAVCPEEPSNLEGCPTCGTFCDTPWTLSWDPVAGAEHYVVEYTCLFSTTQYETNSTSADLCNEVGMCDDASCANGAGAVTVSACTATCCSMTVTFPAAETPIACGGGVCC